jgi:MYXO-CTERM domain-containing protein
VTDGRQASRVLLAAGLTGAFAFATAAALPRAHACGCFTPPDPSVPVVQAGERIAFAMKDGNVTAHIQIQYQGNATEFGWLLPLPSIPDMQLGTDELFTQLIATTQPKYRLVQNYVGNCGFGQFGRGVNVPAAAGSGGASGNAGPSDSSSPLVFQASIGPYDYAVLKADSKDPMLMWLADNHYFVPAGTDQTVGAYIRPGAYFLALKLQSGQSTGDLQPVVVKYASDLPMIPIVLTSVAAQPHMGIQVWMLGASRAIPRNYFHTVINDLLIDWWTSGSNYNDVVINAVAEAGGKHSYVTEYAGTSSIMKQVLNRPGRFGDLTELAAQPTAILFVQYMWSHGFPLTSPVLAILGRSIPYPPGFAKLNIPPQQFYQNLSFYLTDFMNQQPDAYAGWPGVTYMPDQMAKDLDDRIIKPTLAAGAMFDDNSYLTRLYTTLSPEDMTLDPVFSFNPDLPDVDNVHQATLTYYCGYGATANDQSSTPARLVTEQGWSRDFPNGTGPQNPPQVTGASYSRQIQTLRESGPPEVVTDNPPSSGCACAMSASDGARGAGGLLALAGLALARRRRQRR